jgi:hypothetical protein
MTVVMMMLLLLMKRRFRMIFSVMMQRGVSCVNKETNDVAAK